MGLGRSILGLVFVALLLGSSGSQAQVPMPFGFWKAPSAQTIEFTTSGWWTAPAGVTSIDVEGRGTAGTNDSWSSATNGYQISFNYTSATAPTLASANAAIDAWFSAHAATLNSGAPAQRSVTGPYSVGYTLDNGDTVTVAETLRYHSATTYTVRGTGATVRPGNATINTGGKWVFVYATGLEVLTPAAAGSSSTAFSYTFNGGAAGGGAATPVTHTSVPVTPGNNYYINVGYIGYPHYLSGSVKITY